MLLGCGLCPAQTPPAEKPSVTPAETTAAAPAEKPAEKHDDTPAKPREADPAVQQFFQTFGPYTYEIISVGPTDMHLAFRGWRGKRPEGADKEEKDAPPSGPGIGWFLWRCLATRPGDGSLEIRIRAEDLKEPLYLYSVDRAAAVFTVKHIVPQEKQTPLLDLLAKDTGDIEAMPLPDCDLDFWRDFRAGLTKVDSKAPEYADAMTAAKKAYDARRPGLIRKFSGSWLYYPAVGDARWSLHKKGDSLVAATGCSDLMYYAAFYIEMKKDERGRWIPVKISGFEGFKGE